MKKTSKTISKRSAKRNRAPVRPRKLRPPRSRAIAVVEAEPVDSTPEPLAAIEVSTEPAVVLDIPEPSFASRMLPPEPERPFPAARRAIFFDVENASRPEHIARVIDHLAVDRMGRRTDFVAVGNWRVIGHDTARLLARHGAHLVHSAPSTGVRDWSDLRIAVGAGVWLAGARPGDVLEIVTNDRAFDAVGDVAAGLGIAFRRLSHQGLGEPAVEAPVPVREAAGDARSRRRGRGHRRGGWRDRARPPVPAPPADHEVLAIAEAPAIASAAPASAVNGETPPQTAPHDEIIAVVHDLMQRSPGRPLTLDSLANALKARGFSRPSGSPRLITRLRRIKEISLSRSGVITLLGGGEPEAPPAAQEPELQAVDEAVDAESGPQPGNEALPRPEPSDGIPASRRRRPRRGGWGRRRRAEPVPAV